MPPATEPSSSGTSPSPSGSASRQVSAPAPREIAAALRRRLVGQEEAAREMAVALAKYLGGLRTGNILMIGSSGTGKTTLMRAVEDYLASEPELADRSTLVRLHANVLGEEAARGHAGEAVLRRLLNLAREKLGADAPLEDVLRRMGRGLVFVDEVDKIRSHVGGSPNVTGIRAQEALLTLIENEAVPFELPEWAGGGRVTVDSSALLFVCAGAFEGLYDAVYDRVTIGRDKGALQTVTRLDGGDVQEELPFALRDWLTHEDLFDYGMSPQFLSRFDAVVLLEDLTVDHLVKIFVESSESSLHQSRRFFASRGIHLALSPAAVRRIAEEASRTPRLGARALKEVFRRVIRDFEFEPEKGLDGSGKNLMIDVPEVEAALVD
jgi:ATP-dependent Clp protease ATP-binding subunit ClpX